MRRAVKLRLVDGRQASRLASVAAVSVGFERAETLRKWLLEKSPHSELLVHDATNGGADALRETPMAKAAIAILERQAWLVRMAPETVVRGAVHVKVGDAMEGASCCLRKTITYSR